MDRQGPTEALAAMGQETRYAALRLLVDAGEAGLSAGDLARGVGASPSNVSFHMAALVQARLATSERRGQSIIYRVDAAALAGLLENLRRDLGGGSGS